MASQHALGGELVSQHALGRGFLHPGGGGSASRRVLIWGRGSVSSGVCIQGARGLHLGGGWADPTSEIHGILWDMVNKRAVSILLECILVVIANIRVVITDHKSGTRLRFAS